MSVTTASTETKWSKAENCGCRKGGTAKNADQAMLQHQKDCGPACGRVARGQTRRNKQKNANAGLI